MFFFVKIILQNFYKILKFVLKFINLNNQLIELEIAFEKLPNFGQDFRTFERVASNFRKNITIGDKRLFFCAKFGTKTIEKILKKNSCETVVL